MKKILRILPVVAILVSACAGNNDKEKREQEYASQLREQIKKGEASIDSCDKVITEMRSIEDSRMAEFTMINNEREAAPYILYTPTQDLYPLTKTGIAARLSDNGQFEIIAALARGRFDQIRISSGTLTAESNVVANDQALNYYADNLNTVLFSGAEADSIGMLIYGNDQLQFKLEFLKEKPVKSVEITQREALMIGRTYSLYHARKEINKLERRIPMLNQRILLLNKHLEKLQPTSSKQ